MIFDLLTTAVLAMPAIFAILNIKEKAKLEEHLRSAIIIATFSAIFGFLSAIESAMGLPQLSVTSQALVPLTTGIEILQPFLTFIGALVAYFLVAFVAVFVFKIEEGI